MLRHPAGNSSPPFFDWLPKEVADRLNPIAMRIGEQFRLYGLRAKINFRCLLKCLAYRNNRRIVSDQEFKEFLELADFMNLYLNLTTC